MGTVNYRTTWYALICCTTIINCQKLFKRSGALPLLIGNTKETNIQKNSLKQGKEAYLEVNNYIGLTLLKRKETKL